VGVDDDPKPPPAPGGPPEGSPDGPKDPAAEAKPPAAAAETPAPAPAGPPAPAPGPTPTPTQAPGEGAAKAPAPKPPAKPVAPKPPPPPPGPPDPAPPADVPVPAFVAALQAALPGAVEHVSYFVGDWTLIVPLERLIETMRHLREASDAAFDFCSDVTASDWPTRDKRFDVIYCLYSTRLRHRVRVKVRASEVDPVPSVTPVWLAANWLEREVYDLFGVNFTGHPDRRRILMPDDWQGHPQRKDYPLEGPGELLMENPLDWLRLRQVRDEAEIE